MAKGDVIARLARSQNFTQPELARKAGWSETSVINAWRGKSTTVRILECIAQALGVTVEEISDAEAGATERHDSATSESTTEVAGEKSDNPVDRLVAIVTDVLSNSEATRKLIVKYNDILDDGDSEQLAQDIFDSAKPMTCVHNCVDREIYAAHRSELDRCMPLLADALAPVCLSLENFETLQQYVDGEGRSTVSVDTKYELTARAAVGFVKGLPIDSRLVAAFDELCEWDRPSGRDRIGGLPPPPESGRGYGSSSHNHGGTIIDAFRIGLSRLLASASDELASVQSALRLAGQQMVFLCVLFRQQQSPRELDELKSTFPELILLVSGNESEPSDNHDVLNQIKYIRKFFNADRAKG